MSACCATGGAAMTLDETAEFEKQISYLENKIFGYMAAEAKITEVIA